jgi:hypothetical protein
MQNRKINKRFFICLGASMDRLGTAEMDLHRATTLPFCDLTMHHWEADTSGLFPFPSFFCVSSWLPALFERGCFSLCIALHRSLSRSLNLLGLYRRDIGWNPPISSPSVVETQSVKRKKSMGL